MAYRAGVPPDLAVGKPLPKHACYAAQATARDFWRRSNRSRWDYSAGHDAGGREILPQHERELPDRFKRRSAQAIPRKYVGPILDRYNDHVCRGKVVRQGTGAVYDKIKADADGAGTSLDQFMRRALRSAQTEGLTYLLADANVDGAYATAADEIAAGRRPILRRISADGVPWWRDWQGQVMEAIVLLTDRDGSTFGWYVTETTTQRISIDPKEGKVTNIEPPRQHTYGGCPLVRLVPLFDDDSDVGDDSQAAPLAEIQKLILNLDSLHHEELYGSTFTTPVFLGVSAEEVKDVIVGPGKGLALPGSDGRTPALGKLGADPAQAQSLREATIGWVRELYRIAGLSPGNPTETGAPESGVAKAFAFNEVETRLAALADAAEAAENLSMQRMAKSWGFAYQAADWPDSFDVQTLADELETVIRITTSQLPDVLKDNAVRSFADHQFKLSPDEKTQLDEQLVEPIEPPANPFAPPPGRMAGT